MHADATLTEIIYNASVRAFEDWRKAHPGERVFASALSTLDEAIYVNAALNSEESHQRQLEERQLDPSCAYGLDTRWGPWEWENEFTGQSHFGVVDDRLQANVRAVCGGLVRGVSLNCIRFDVAGIVETARERDRHERR